MGNDKIQEILRFIKKCDLNFNSGIFDSMDASKAVVYKHELESFFKRNDNTRIMAIINKLDFIINQIDAVNYHNYKRAAILNLVSVSVTDYIASLIAQKHLTDPLLIARFAYIELSKVLYYDISYVKLNDEGKSILCNAPVDVTKEKIFSYVVCTQWLQLYQEILSRFGIEVKKMNYEGQYHVWGEINLNDDYIIIADGTDYINSSIDLSNAKSQCATVGFAVLPKKFSGLKLYDIFADKNNIELAKEIKIYYEKNRDFDEELGYIKKTGYKDEQIIKSNDLFQVKSSNIKSEKDLHEYIKKTVEF